MDSDTIEKHRLAAEILAREMEELIDGSALNPVEQNTAVNARIRALHEEINSYGFLAHRKMSLNVKTFSLKTTVTLVAAHS